MSFYNTPNKKNFPFEYNGETLWFSRSCAVVGLVVKIVNGNMFILANKRGIGTPDFQGYWNLPCGYLDWNETIDEAVSREVKEETGINIDPTNWHLFDINSDPNENRQNVSIIYYYISSSLNQEFSTDGNELNEVEEIKWVDIDKINEYEWAFNHESIIKKFIKKFYEL